MTTPGTVAPPPAPAAPSVMEDIVDIFHSPTAVFERRRADPKFGLALLILAILMAVAMFLFFTNLQTAMEGDFNRQMQGAMEKNPQITPEMVETMRGMQMGAAKWVGPIATVIGVCLLGVLIWIVGKLFGAAFSIAGGMMIATFAWYPRIIQMLVSAVQGMLMSGDKLRGLNVVSIGPARFLDPNTASPTLIQFLLRFDVFVIWSTIIVAIGMYVLGRIPKGKAILAAVVVWLVAFLPALWQARR